MFGTRLPEEPAGIREEAIQVTLDDRGVDGEPVEIPANDQ